MAGQPPGGVAPARAAASAQDARWSRGRDRDRNSCASAGLVVRGTTGKAKGRRGGPGGVGQEGLRGASACGLRDQSWSRKPDLSPHGLVGSVGQWALGMSELRHLANVLSLREPRFAPLCCENMHLGPSGEASARDASTLQPFLDSPRAGQLRGRLSG